MKNQFIYKNIYFSEGTPIDLCDTLISLYEKKTRIIIDYGNITTKESWNEKYDITGRICKSTGVNPILILVHNTRSLGGGSIMTDCILNIKNSIGKQTLYQL